ncbi:nuclease SbcCD subunit D [Companilactobacillus crustorum]|uniref:Nuclease SbcCD subunit D n=3 Tax=Companilactobacillus TaxID=2767879 RepID=A0A837RET2_9LACO|nr:exonuclease SbcCD subunit D [Companilactobacillus crustorum]HCD07395.1 exonuclease SbcCD subunit D [Lactobacillus sp.]KRK41224.1 exonuclease SbcD [Companilactobacillus crustorum JCM 15951]KRO17921.1 exonuclease SbcD [Companilactobacillus crustorum]WDT65659.1 exonuclease SbcCD subunit D [Companilactobacillus crustorum]GEO77483.1 nuclease SbcCD subunit D [Companilactobacillus crustorum]
MKLLHTADWHIGRTLNGYSLLNEQEQTFQQILQIAKDEQVDGVVIAGDIYDRAVPNPEAVSALNKMLREINLENNIPIYAISGNHDSAKRLNYGRDWMEYTNFHLNTFLEEAFHPIETDDIQIFLLPFFDPLDARVYYQKQGMPAEKVKKITTIADAMKLVIADMKKNFNNNKMQLLITHFSVTPNKDEEIELTSETTSKVGGLATLTADQFKDFDYVMLGHIHTRFASPDENIRYSGSPVKFNIKEARLKNKGKGVDIVTLEKDSISRVFKPLLPTTDLVVLEENWETLCDPKFYKKQPINKDWFAITIKNFDRSEHLQTNIRAELQKRYGTVVELDYESNQNDFDSQVNTTNISELSPEDTVEQFFETITGKDLSAPQKSLVETIFNEIEREKK